MSITVPAFDAARTAELGLNPFPGPGYALPAPRGEVIGLCIACGCELTDRDDAVECECWSMVLREALPCLMCETCYEEASGEQ